MLNPHEAYARRTEFLLVKTQFPNELLEHPQRVERRGCRKREEARAHTAATFVLTHRVQHG